MAGRVVGYGSYKNRQASLKPPTERRPYSIEAPPPGPLLHVDESSSPLELDSESRKTRESRPRGFFLVTRGS